MTSLIKKDDKVTVTYSTGSSFKAKVLGHNAIGIKVIEANINVIFVPWTSIRSITINNS